MKLLGKGEAEARETPARVSPIVSILAWCGYGFLLLPTLVVVPMSFGNTSALVFPPDSLSLDLYRQFFGSASWIDSALRSVYVAAGATVIALILGMPAAYAIARGRFVGKNVVTVFLLSPVMVPVIVVALGMYFYFSRLHLVGTTWGIMLGHAAYTTPFVIITCVSGLRQLDPRLEAAARVMGAGSLRVFSRVVIPLLRPAIVAGALFAFLMSFDEVVISYFIAQAGTMTLPVRMFNSIRWEISPVLAAVSTILSLLSLAVCLVAAALQRK
jgi:putative spermidine/putrescine transport system permease protein